MSSEPSTSDSPMNGRLGLRLNLGCGGHPLPDFVNVDIAGAPDLEFDLRHRLPFPDSSVDGIYHEHFIEHLTQEDGLALLRECRRVLRPGGQMRVATPDLDAVVEEYQSADWKHPEWTQYGMGWVVNRCEMLNLAMREWGHLWVYNEVELCRLAALAGLESVRRWNRGEAAEPSWQGLESRAGSRLVFELRRPVPLPGLDLTVIVDGLSGGDVARTINSVDRDVSAILVGSVPDGIDPARFVAVIAPSGDHGADQRAAVLASATEAVVYLHAGEVLRCGPARRLAERLCETPSVSVAGAPRMYTAGPAPRQPLADDGVLDGSLAASWIVHDRWAPAASLSGFVFRRSLVEIRTDLPTAWCGVGGPQLGGLGWLLTSLSQGDLGWQMEPIVEVGVLPQVAPGVWSFLADQLRRKGLLRFRPSLPELVRDWDPTPTLQSQTLAALRPAAPGDKRAFVELYKLAKAHLLWPRLSSALIDAALGMGTRDTALALLRGLAAAVPLWWMEPPPALHAQGGPALPPRTHLVAFHLGGAVGLRLRVRANSNGPRVTVRVQATGAGSQDYVLAADGSATELALAPGAAAQRSSTWKIEWWPDGVFGAEELATFAPHLDVVVELVNPSGVRAGPAIPLDAMGAGQDLLPWRGRPRRTYLIASVPRSGSSLLGRALSLTGLAGAPLEYFNPPLLRAFAQRCKVPLRGEGVDLEATVQALTRRRTTPNGVFGFKMHHHQKIAVFGPKLDPAEAFGGLTTILIRRADRLAQAVSYARGLQTGQWSKGEVATQEPSYDEALIRRCLADIVEEEAAWKERAARRGEAVLELVYEEFIADYERTILRVLDFLGVDAGPGFRVPPPPMEKQADALNEQWCRQYKLANGGENP